MCVRVWWRAHTRVNVPEEGKKREWETPSVCNPRQMERKKEGEKNTIIMLIIIIIDWSLFLARLKMDSGYYFYSGSRGEKQDVGRVGNKKDSCLSLSRCPPGATWTQPAAGQSRGSKISEEMELGKPWFVLMLTYESLQFEVRCFFSWHHLTLLPSHPDTPGPTFRKNAGFESLTDKLWILTLAHFIYFERRRALSTTSPRRASELNFWYVYNK